MGYAIEPGLYAMGKPDKESPVFVTANYKMSFDRLREALPGRDAWILVLDTKGVNVWCAAGKGSFGTAELSERIEAGSLAQVVAHRKLILPQLAAPGVSAHRVKKISGFEVVYGPVRAADLPRFLDAGMKATPEMRRKTFTTRERAALIPVELVAALKTAFLAFPALFFIGGLGGPGGFWENAVRFGVFAVLAVLIAVMAGAVLVPLLLPWLPGRAFSLKGASAGLAAAFLLIIIRGMDPPSWSGRLESLAWMLIIPAVTAYLAMNFTGASTYTGLSGVRKEMRWAVPLQIGAGAAGLGLLLVSRFTA